MIHLHSMLSSETGTSNAGQNARTPLSPARLDTFHGALSDAVSSTLEKSGIPPNQVDISITHSDTLPSSKGAGSSSTTNSAAPNDGYDPFLQAALNNPYESAPVQSSTSPTSQTASDSNAAPVDAQQAADDAYWANQPAPVQALRTMQDQGQRASMATQLANEGYSIDVPIMVWGWDPSITMAMRQADGYTWVPSALQNSVEVAPGLSSVGTLTAYNPNNPPAGSIAVS